MDRSSAQRVVRSIDSSAALPHISGPINVGFSFLSHGIPNINGLSDPGKTGLLPLHGRPPHFNKILTDHHCLNH